ncbi:hypothetical protein AURDEDRAFT_176991, partial [Auricularia subglabra TFB-10046 SS5]
PLGIIPAAGEAASPFDSRATLPAASSRPPSALNAHLRAAVLWQCSGGLGAFAHRGGFVVTSDHSPPASNRRAATPALSIDDPDSPVFTIFALEDALHSSVPGRHLIAAASSSPPTTALQHPTVVPRPLRSPLMTPIRLYSPSSPWKMLFILLSPGDTVGRDLEVAPYPPLAFLRLVLRLLPGPLR